MVSREHVAVKRLTLPTIEVQELPEMTRLALHRDLPFDPQEAVIDFVATGRAQSLKWSPHPSAFGKAFPYCKAATQRSPGPSCREDTWK